MKAVDFSRSFLTFRIDTLKKPPKTVSHRPPFTLNNARIQIDCRCEIEDKRGGAIEEFVSGASCKTERVGVEQDIWPEPNADFVPIFSREKFMHLKTYDRADKSVMLYPPSLGVQSERLTGKVAEAFDDLRIDIVTCDGEVLETPDQIIESTLANEPLVAQTKVEGERHRVTLEYPVKTMSANERDKIYQTDTGPLLFPDLTRDSGDLLGGMELAFAAFNSPHWTEFIVRAKTLIAEGVHVYHYCKPVRLDAVNRIIRLKVRHQ